MFRSLTNDCVSLESETRQGRKASIFPASMLGPWPMARSDLSVLGETAVENYRCLDDGGVIEGQSLDASQLQFGRLPHPVASPAGIVVGPPANATESLPLKDR
jgi:hypothetical protein